MAFCPVVDIYSCGLLSGGLLSGGDISGGLLSGGFLSRIPENYQNLIIGFQVTVKNEGDVFLRHSILPLLLLLILLLLLLLLQILLFVFNFPTDTSGWARSSFFMCESSCFQRILAIAILSVHLSIT